MQTNLKWKKGLFSNLYKIYSNGKQIGNLKDKLFSQSSIGILNNKEYLFKTTGFLKQQTQVIDIAENKMIGKISYNNWMTKATITINDKKINWKYNNILTTKWSLFGDEKVNIKYSGSSIKGQIISSVEDSLLILSGLFVTNYYWQKTITVVITALVPIWIILN